MRKPGAISFVFIMLMTGIQLLHGQSLPEPDGRRLRDIIADKYPEGNLIIGGTTGEWAFGTATGNLMDREFSYVTPENDFKQPGIHGNNSDVWAWNKFCRSNHKA